MANRPGSETRADVLTQAVLRGILSESDAEELIREAARRGADPGRLAVESGLIEPAELDVCEALADPDGYIPGYALVELIGRGAVGAVYRARQQASGRDVALKVINLRRFAGTKIDRRCRIEGEIVTRLAHPHVVEASDYGVHDERFYLAMEALDGETLADRIAAGGPVDERFAWSVARQVAAGLSHAESQGVVHRDVKPANICLTSARWEDDVPVAKITDFGLAFETGRLDHSRLTTEGTTLGTLSYVAPEQLEETHVDRRADIYALGATTYHMLSGKPPYADAKGVTSLLVAKTAGDEAWRRQLPPHVSPDGAALLLAMTAYDPEDRIPSYENVIDRIDGILARLAPATAGKVRAATSGQPAHQPPAPAPAAAAGSRRWWLIAATAVAAAALGTLVAFSLF